MEFPVEVRYRMGPIPLALFDAHASPIGYADKAPGFPQHMTVYADEAKTTPIYKLASDNVNSFSVEFRFATPQGKPLGSVKRFGKRSVWRAFYEVRVGETTAFAVEEVNPFVKVANFVVGMLPFMNFFTGSVLNPTFRLARSDGAEVMLLKKTGPGLDDPTWAPGRQFSIAKVGAITDAEQEVALLALMIVVTHESTRG